MKTRTLVVIASLLLIFCGSTAGLAQKSIDNLVVELEKRDDINITSVVKRDPQGKDIIQVVKSFTFEDEKMAKKLENAFEKEESKATSATKNRNPNLRNSEISISASGKGSSSARYSSTVRTSKKSNYVTYMLKFDDKNSHSMYSLSVSSTGEVKLSIVIEKGKTKRLTSYYERIDPSLWCSRAAYVMN